MYSRIFNPDSSHSYFLFGARGTGKSSWLRAHYQKSTYIDLLDDEIYNNLSAQPKNIADYISDSKHPIVIDEVQKIPHLLDEVHRLIELKKYRFILSGSSARKLRKSGVNLLAGRAYTYNFHPMTSVEMGTDFNLNQALQFGLLPMTTQVKDPMKYLQSYVRTYLKEEVQQEGLTRNLPAFSRFLQAASFSQASPLNVSKVASECAVDRKVVEDYFSILNDLLLTVQLPVFSKRAKRDLITKSKFFFFDNGVYRTIRPRGPLDSESELNGFSLETLVMQNIRALNDYYEWGYELFFWHTRTHQEVDLVLYGPKKLVAIEVKTSARVRKEDLVAMLLFKEDYPVAEAILVYGGTEEKFIQGIRILPAKQFFLQLQSLLS
ncbi:MAG TPA: AAA family ATPase [Pseudobdellovibrionaceae bacterium]|nr:AAA family ATPase [Pseudobdellovibrionaceae bacterium]